MLFRLRNCLLPFWFDGHMHTLKNTLSGDDSPPGVKAGIVR